MIHRGIPEAERKVSHLNPRKSISAIAVMRDIASSTFDIERSLEAASIRFIALVAARERVRQPSNLLRARV